MAIFQKTLTYPGLDSVPPGARLVFDIPVFRYTELHLPESRDKSPQVVIQREVVDRYKKEQPIEGREYALTVSDSETTRDGNSNLRRQYLVSQFATGDVISRINLEDISFVVTVTIVHNGAVLGQQELEVIDVAGLGNRVQQEIFFVNKRAYTRLVDQMNMGGFSTVLLGALFNAVHFQDDGVTIVQKEFVAVVQRVLQATYGRVAEPERAALLAALPALLKRIDDFDLGTLLDFPIAVPRLSFDAHRVGGSFTVDTSTPERVTPAMLEFYALTLEYSNGREVRTVRVPWENAGAFRANQPLPFAAVLRDAISGPVLVSVSALGERVVWQRQLELAEGGLDDISIRVPLVQPTKLGVAAPGASEVARRLRGRLIQTGAGERSLSGLTVLIQARSEGDALWRTVTAAETDRSGNFSAAYPFGNYNEAQALVSLSPDRPTPLRMTGRGNESIPDDFLFLLLSERDSVASAAPTDDCDCHAPQQAQRLPDQQDLINSDEYTQDVGGACVNLSTPNRTLREYRHQAIVRVSDPNVANYTLEKVTDHSGNVRYRLNGGGNTLLRSSVGLDNPIRWQDAPDASQNLTLYQAVSVATGHLLHYKSIFKADGYSMGELLYSLPLAPGQKKQIVVFDSAHTLSGAESQTLSQGESLSASLTNDRSITDQLSGAIGEAMNGSSNAHTSGMSAGLGAAGSMGPIGGSLGVSGGFANSNSSASQNSSRDVSQFFGERLRQSIMQNAEGYRRMNATVVTTVREGQQYAVTAESIANHNHCHAVTMMYFEVLRHYAIYQELAQVEECVFVPLLMTHFTTENISKWRDVLSRALLPVPSNTYLQPFNALTKLRQHPLLRAFDANERIKTGYTQVDYPEEHERYADEPMTSVQGSLTLRINLQRPKTRYDRIKSLPMVTQTVSHQELDVEATVKKNALLAGVPFGFLGMGSETRTVTEEIIVVGKIFDQFMSLDANYATVAPARCIRVVSFLPRPITQADGTVVNASDEFFDGGGNDKRLWSAYAALLDYPGEGGVYEMLQYYFAGKLISEWDEIFYNDIVPQVFHRIVDGINFERIAFDATALDRYNGGERSVKVRLRAASLGITRRALPESLTISTNELVRALNGGAVLMRVENVQLSYTTDHFEGTLYNGFVGDDLFDGVVLHIPLTAADKRNPRKEDRFVVKQLIEHLNSQIEHYNKALWYNLDPDRRFMLLDGFHIQVFDERGNPAGHRSLASVVKNQLITITGNAMVFPVAAGYRLSQSHIVEDDAESPTLLDHYQPLTPAPPYRISVPTRGVFLEAVQSACDSCEKVKPNSSQDWSKFGVDEPTPISPVTTPVPVVTDWRAAFKDFAQPLVSIQNAPATPEPGAGLAGLAELLGKAGVFNDITGLQGNQQNAIRTYLSNQENVRAMADMAKGLAMQQHNTANSQSITDSITQAREAGSIGAEEESSLMRQHLQQQIDGGELARQAAQMEREQGRSSLTEAAVEATRRGAAVRAERSDSDGTREVLEVQQGNPQAAESTGVRHDVDPLRQRNPRACWATAAAMMVGWRDGVSVPSIEAVLEEAGENLTPPEPARYVTAFRENSGLSTAEKANFIAALGLMAESPASYTAERYLALLQDYGPLWITTDDDLGDQFSPHARVLVAMRREASNWRMTFVDPAQGREESELFEAFVAHLEELIRQTRPDAPLHQQVVHFRQPTGVVEGQAASGSPASWNPRHADERNGSADRFASQTWELEVDATTQEQSGGPRRVRRIAISIFVPRAAPADRNKVHVFFGASSATEAGLAHAGVNDLNTHGLRGASDATEWITIGVPGIEPGHASLDTAAIEQALRAAGRSTRIDALRLTAHSRGYRGLSFTLLRGLIASPTPECVVALDDAYSSLDSALQRRRIPGSRQVAYIVTLFDRLTTSGAAHRSIPIVASRIVGYVRIIEDAIARGVVVPAVIASEVARLPGIPARGSFTTDAAPGAGMTSLAAFYNANRDAFAELDARRDDPVVGLKHYIDANDLALMGVAFTEGIDAHHWFVAEIAHELFR
jgi:hypothetical protein